MPANCRTMVAELDVLVQLQRAAQVEPLHDLRNVGAFEVVVVDLAHGGADQLARHRVAALQLAFVFQFELAGDGRQRGVDIDDRAARRASSLARRARRSALDTTFSSTEMGRRWETPERLSMRLSSRARNASCSTISRMYSRHVHLDRRGPLEPGLLRGDRHALLDAWPGSACEFRCRCGP